MTPALRLVLIALAMTVLGCQPDGSGWHGADVHLVDGTWIGSEQACGSGPSEADVECRVIVTSTVERVEPALRDRVTDAVIASLPTDFTTPSGERREARLWTDSGQTWYQPPTTFNTIGITEGSSREQYGSGGRQLFSLERLRELARLAPPQTDTTKVSLDPSTSQAGGPFAVLALAGLVGALVTLRRTTHRR